MRIFTSLIPVILLTSSPVMAATPAATFHVDNLIPGEGAESDCYTAFWNASAKSPKGEDTPPHIFDIVSEHAYIKIDGKVYVTETVAKSQRIAKTDIYEGDHLRVEEQSNITRVDKSDDGDTYYLKGTLKVTFQGMTQTLPVRGESFCYSGE